MQVLLIGGEKGGTGKSTVATNLAVWLAHRGEDVLLLDADRQGTAALWAAERAANSELAAVHCVQHFDNLSAPIRDLRQRYARIIIDAGGRDSRALRSAMVAADAVYSPVKASQSDLWTVEHLNELVGEARAINERLRAVVVLSMAPTNPRINEPQDAAELLSEFSELWLSRATIRDRKAFRDAMFQGRGVVELEDAKASAEINLLGEEIYGQIQETAAA